jgi:hypothetical protein
LDSSRFFSSVSFISLQLFGPLRSFLAAAGLLDEFDIISIGNSKRGELVLKQQQQQHGCGLHPHAAEPQQQQQQQQEVWQQQQQQQHARGLHAHAAEPQQQQQQQVWQQQQHARGLHTHAAEPQQQQQQQQVWQQQQQQQVMYTGSVWQQEPEAAAAAAAPSYDGYDNPGDVTASCAEMPLVIEAVQRLQQLRAQRHAVPMRAVMESTSAADGNSRSLFARLGGSGAAAVAFLRRWPHIFDVHEVMLDHPVGPAGVKIGFQVQMQQGALRWLLTTQQFRQQLAVVRAALLAAVQGAAAAAAPRERRGVEVGKVGNRTPSGFMTPAMMQYRQVSMMHLV